VQHKELLLSAHTPMCYVTDINITFMSVDIGNFSVTI